jgi:hypothetical protein
MYLFQKQELLMTQGKKMMDKFDDLEDALKSTVLYKKKNGTWPWRTEAFFKQDNHPQNRETYWVTLP